MLGKTQFQILIAVTTALLIVLLFTLFKEGKSHIDAASSFRLSRESWQSGKTVRSVQYFVNAIWMSLDGGTRYFLAKPYFRNTNYNLDKGDKREALASCIKGVRILGPYDDEGSLNYYCGTIKFQIEQEHLELIQP